MADQYSLTNVLLTFTIDDRDYCMDVAYVQGVFQQPRSAIEGDRTTTVIRNQEIALLDPGRYLTSSSTDRFFVVLLDSERCSFEGGVALVVDNVGSLIELSPQSMSEWPSHDEILELDGQQLVYIDPREGLTWPSENQNNILV